MKYKLNIKILLFDIFKIIFNIYMKYLIHSVYHAPSTIIYFLQSYRCCFVCSTGLKDTPLIVRLL